jgi:hypothetical protein
MRSGEKAAEAPKAAARTRPPAQAYVLWGASMGLFALVLAPVGEAIARELSLQSVIATDQAAMDAYRPVLPGLEPIDAFEAISEIALSGDDLKLALENARKAVEADPGRAFVWARLAYLETEQAGQVNSAALNALGRSIDGCPLCDEELIRWRFSYVLANWPQIPEDLRHRTFETADILRWTGRNADFLAEMRIKSMAAGVPFDQYRAAVKSPVHTWELDYIEPPAVIPHVAPPVVGPETADLRPRAED